MDVLAPLIAHRQAPELPQPGHRSFHHPAVPSQLRRGLDPLAGNPHLDVPLAQCLPAAGNVICLVRMHLHGTGARSSVGTADGPNRIEQLLEDGAVMAIRPSDPGRQRGAVAVGHDMAFGARFAAIRRTGTGRGAPFWAGMLALSRQARSQSI